MSYQPDDRDFTLGFIVNDARLLDAPDVHIPEDFFRIGLQREVWARVQEIRRAGRPISLVAIMEGESTNGLVDYLSGITARVFPIKPEEFRRRVLKEAAEDVKKRMQSLAATAYPDSDELIALVEEFRRLQLEVESDGPESKPTSLILSDVEAKRVPWLWQDFIPLGRATLISGDPGSAKTWFCLDLAARLSKGYDWPDGSPGIGPARTYYLTVEDDLHDTIRPRIDSLGGDPAMIAVFNSEHPLHLDLNKPEGLRRLENELVRLGNIRLVVIDPIIDFSGDSNPNAGEEVRALLTPLIRLASKLNFALILIGHLNKAQTMSAIYRAGGSTSGWLGKCRAAFMIFRDIDDKALRHVVPIKANLAPQDPRQLEFRIISGRLEAEVSKEDVDPDEQLNPQRGPNPKERDEAVSWLAEFFADREEIPSKEVDEAAKTQGISEKTLKRAKKKAGYKAVKRYVEGGKSHWAVARNDQGGHIA